MLELRFPVTPDDHAVIDGVQLARAMIYNAVRLLIPYVGGCPGCVNIIFDKVANGALNDIHEDLQNGEKDGVSYVVGLEGEKRDEAIRAHLAASKDTIVALLESDNVGQCH